jgi:hypothetical protein
VDRFGNTNASINGSAHVSLAESPDTQGSDYCVDSSSYDGTACLLGKFSANLENGFANFTNIFIKFSAPNFTLKFHVVFSDDSELSVLSQRFHVLPPPPRIIGMTFSVTFTHLILTFDSSTNMAGMQGSGNCAQLFASTAVQAFAQTARCDWRDPTTVWILLGNNAAIYPSDCLVLNSNVAITSAVTWIQVPLTNGVQVNQLATGAEAVNVDFQLISPKMLTPLCFPVNMPAQIELSSIFNSEMDLTISAVKHFSTGGNHYFFVAKFCSGLRCKIDVSLSYTTAKMEINSSVYLWSTSRVNPLIRVQDIPSQGPVAVLLPTIYDTSIHGGISRRQFLFLVNSQQKTGRVEFALGAVDIYVWRDRGPMSGFEFRQEITFENRPVHASTIADENGTILVVATEVNVVVLRWVEGSFRASSTMPLPLGWFPGEKFGWVPGQFLENIQTLPGNNPYFSLLHRVPDRPQDLYLAVAESTLGGTVNVFQWDSQGCIVGCFLSEPFASLPAVAPRSIASFSAGGYNFIVIANHAEGSTVLDQVRMLKHP